jgi:hypothetical protein
MLYREIIAVCSEIHTKHINTLCGQNVEFLNVEPGGTYVTTGISRANELCVQSPCCLRNMCEADLLLNAFSSR